MVRIVQDSTENAARPPTATVIENIALRNPPEAFKTAAETTSATITTAR
tara:strand:+ start:182 stop:328 length:147 start_codon:yes stop_codon:yes gene_type:complete